MDGVVAEPEEALPLPRHPRSAASRLLSSLTCPYVRKPRPKPNKRRHSKAVCSRAREAVEAIEAAAVGQGAIEAEVAAAAVLAAGAAQAAPSL